MSTQVTTGLQVRKSVELTIDDKKLQLLKARLFSMLAERQEKKFQHFVLVTQSHQKMHAAFAWLNSKAHELSCRVVLAK